MRVYASNSEKDVTISNGTIVGSASISTNGSLFKILSENLYKDPIKAFVRELLFNAWDSHKAAGKTSTSIRVDITDNLFTIQDFGTGIPHNKINDIYLTYGDSTKLDNNTLTGGFGLGSKSPFGYTNYFTITNIHNSKKVIYRIVKNGENLNIPQIIKVHSENTEECNGLTVSIPIKSKDVSIIISHVKHFSYYGEMFINDTKNNINLTEEDNYLFINKYVNKIFFLYGGILYPYKDCNISFIMNITTRESLIIKVPEGITLSIAPSRDSLHLDHKTSSYCNSLLDETIKKINNKILKCIKEFTPIYIDIVKTSPLYNITVSIQEAIKDHINKYEFSNHNINLFLERYITIRFINHINKSYRKKIIVVYKILRSNIDNFKVIHTKTLISKSHPIILKIYISTERNIPKGNFTINSYNNFKKVYPLLNKLDIMIEYLVPKYWISPKLSKLPKKKICINYKWETVRHINDIYSIKKILKKTDFHPATWDGTKIVILNSINRPLRVSDFTNKELIIYNTLSLLGYKILFLKEEYITNYIKVYTSDELLNIIKNNKLFIAYFLLKNITSEDFYRVSGYICPNQYLPISTILLNHINNLFINKKDRSNYSNFIKANYLKLYLFFSTLKEGVKYISNKTNKEIILDKLSDKEIKELARNYNKIAKIYKIMEA